MNQDSDIQQKLMELKREIRDLKTAKAIPSTIHFYRKTLQIPAGSYSNLKVTVHYASDDSGSEPILFYYSSGVMLARPYDPVSNTQLIEIQGDITYYSYSAPEIAYSNREIISMTYSN